MKSEYDIVIIGGGPAGLSAAISILQKVKLSLLVLESQTEGAERIGENCPPDTILLLQKLGLDKAFYKAKHAPCPGFASAWGKEQVGYNDSITNPLGPSWRLNRQSFDKMLKDKAIELGSDIEHSMHFVDSHKTIEGYQLRVRNQKLNKESQITCRFAIDASGSNARFAKSLGIDKRIEDQLFAQVQMAEIVQSSKTAQVQLETVPKGWWYHTTVPNNRSIVMMVTDQQNLVALRESDYHGFEEQLAETKFISNNLNKLIIGDKKFYSWPIYSGILRKIEGEDWVAIGDSASSFDPISAQGIYKGLSDGINCANKVIKFFQENIKTDLSPFSEMVKRRYQVYRKNRLMMYFIERRWQEAPFWQNRIKSMAKVSG